MLNSFLIILFLTGVGVFADSLLKTSGQGEKFIEWRWFWPGLIIYASTAFGWFYVMKHIKLSTLGVFYAVSTVILLTLVSVVFFKENLNMMEGIGIIMAITSLILLSRFA